MQTKYFLNRNDYIFQPFLSGGLSGEKKLAIPKNKIDNSYVIKSSGRECACCEFVGLRLAKLMGINVPEAFLVFPKKNEYEVAIEYLSALPMPSLDQIRNDENLLHSYILCILTHSLFGDLDNIDFLNYAGKIYTFDFADGFGIDDFAINIMERQADLAHQVPAWFLSQFTSPIIDYDPQTLLLYEILVNDRQICNKEYFDSCLNEICSRFALIPDSEIRGILEALGELYPQALVAHFERYISEIKKFCQE